MASAARRAGERGGVVLAAEAYAVASRFFAFGQTAKIGFNQNADWRCVKKDGALYGIFFAVSEEACRGAGLAVDEKST